MFEVELRLSEFEFEFMRGNFRNMQSTVPDLVLFGLVLLLLFLFLLYVLNDKNED